MATKHEQSVGQETAGFLQAVMAVDFGKAVQVQPVAGAQGGGDAVVVVGVGIELFAVAGAVALVDGFDILADVADVPAASDVGRVVPIAGVVA